MPPRRQQRKDLMPPDRELTSRAVFSVHPVEECTSPLALGRLKDRPATLKSSLTTARKWVGGNNGFIQMICRLRLAYFNHGFQVVNGGDWWTKNEMAARTYARSAWQEWLTTDNVVALWLKNSPPTLLLPEDCEYQDKFGLEILTYEHGLTNDEIEKLPLSAALKQRLKEKTSIELQKKDDAIFGFEVAKRSAPGEGLSWPSLQSAFLGASTHESLEVADSQLAAMMRRVYERHRKGHETRFGINSGGTQNNLKKTYKDEFLKSIKGKRGAMELIVNWDHDIDWPRPDPKHFDERRYGAALASLKQWALPFGHMLAATTINPYLLVMLAELANLERSYLEAHLIAVFQRAMKAPAAIRCKWSDDCFFDPRLRFDMLKLALAGGPLSQETYLERIGENAEMERSRKAKEKKLPKSQTQPLYDPAHGAPDTAGRKTGTGDNQGGD